eukprot:maker-scaffold360_size197209-snap-gene-0.36 protein:Tk00937 transcript:maker-scaffold360_size197209-snap-gene-0.36-mRNA-1 annotation:"transmembrane protein adipocyte-associated 1 homolog"
MDVGEEILEEVNRGLAGLVSNGTEDHAFDSFRTDSFFNPDAGVSEASLCQRVLYLGLSPTSGVRLWDVLILVPNLVFLIGLLTRVRVARQRLRASPSPIFLAFYVLVWVCAVVSVVRAVVSMSISAATPIGDTSDKVLWILLRFSLLATEMSVLVFGLGSGHLDSQRGIRRVVVVAFLVAFAFSFSQAGLELWAPDPHFHVTARRINLFGHGGMLFWLLSSASFALIYLLVLLLPYLPWRKYVSLPHRLSFYRYVAYLLVLYATQTVGIVVYTGHPDGLCIVNLTSFLYFTTFPPIIYYTFLRSFFGSTQPQLLFAYKSQVDEFEDEMNPSTSFQAMNGEAPPPDSVDEPNTPIVMNATNALPIGQGLRNTGLASPDSVVNYNFGGP